MGGLDGWEVMLCLVCVRRFVCLLVGHPCGAMCVCEFTLLKICVFHGGSQRRAVELLYSIGTELSCIVSEPDRYRYRSVRYCTIR